MSVEAITWALAQPISHSSAKFVLVVLANCASGDTMTAFPSVSYIASATGQDRKTVLSNLTRLREWGLIEDTGKRRGETGQVVVYRLCDPDFSNPKQYQKRDRLDAETIPKTVLFEGGNSTKNGTVPKTEQYRKRNSSVFGRKQSQKRDTEPSGTKRASEQDKSCSSASSDFVTSARDVVIALPLNDGTEYPITAEQVREFAGLYPAVDVPQSLRSMRGWCVSNPTNRKTRSGILRFVNHWLAKEQNSARPANGGNHANSRTGGGLSAAERVARVNAEAERRGRYDDALDGECRVVG